MRAIRHVRADCNHVRERVHPHYSEGDSLSIDHSVNNRVGIGAGGRVLYIAEPIGQRLHH